MPPPAGPGEPKLEERKGKDMAIINRLVKVFIAMGAIVPTVTYEAEGHDEDGWYDASLTVSEIDIALETRDPDPLPVTGRVSARAGSPTVTIKGALSSS